MDAQTHDRIEKLEIEIAELDKNLGIAVEDLHIVKITLEMALAELARLDPRLTFALHTALQNRVKARQADDDDLAKSNGMTPEGIRNLAVRTQKFASEVKAMLPPLPSADAS